MQSKILSSMPSTLDTEELAKKIQATLESGWLTNNGPVVQRLEKEVLPKELYLPDDQAISLVTNGTAALQGAMSLFLGKEPMIVFIVPSFTFAATALSSIYSVTNENNIESQVIFCDVDENGIISADSVRQIFKKYWGYEDSFFVIVGVDLFAQDSALVLSEFADRYKIMVDAAQSFGVKTKATYPHLRTYSFHATKTIHCCEGGAIQGPKNLIEKVNQWRNFGFGGDDYGCNAKLDEVRATILEHNIIKSYDVEHYNGALIDYAYRPILPKELFFASNNRYALLRIENQLLRDKIITALGANGAQVKTYFEPLHMQKKFAHMKSYGFSYEKSERLANSFIALPLSWNVTIDQGKKVAEVCLDEINKFRKYFGDEVNHKAD